MLAFILLCSQLNTTPTNERNEKKNKNNTDTNKKNKKKKDENQHVQKFVCVYIFVLFRLSWNPFQKGNGNVIVAFARNDKNFRKSLE